MIFLGTPGDRPRGLPEIDPGIGEDNQYYCWHDFQKGTRIQPGDGAAPASPDIIVPKLPPIPRRVKSRVAAAPGGGSDDLPLSNLGLEAPPCDGKTAGTGSDVEQPKKPARARKSGPPAKPPGMLPPPPLAAPSPREEVHPSGKPKKLAAPAKESDTSSEVLSLCGYGMTSRTNRE